MNRTRRDWYNENKLVKEWVETCPTKFTCADIYEDLKSILVGSKTTEKQVKKIIQQQVGRLVMSNKVTILSKKRGQYPTTYSYIQEPIKNIDLTTEPAKQQTETKSEPNRQEPVVSEHEMGRAIYDYIMYLREENKNLNNDIKAYKHQLKLVREDISDQLKNKDKVIANLNDKIVELNRLVGNRSSSARTFSLGEMAKVTSFKK